MTLTSYAEAATGQRLADSSLFETGRGRRELASPQRQARWGDPDDDDDPGTSPTAGTLAAAARALGQMPGLEGPDASRGRQRATEQRNRVIADRALRSGGRVHPDFAESTRERAGRVRQPIQPVPFSDPVMGELPTFTAGAL